MEGAVSHSDKQTYWEEQVRCWADSGLSQAKFCRASQLTYSTFCYWYQKLKKGPIHKDRVSPFTPIRIHSTQRSPNLRIRRASGDIIEIPLDISDKRLGLILKFIGGL